MNLPGYRPGLSAGSGSVKRRVASKMSGLPPYVHPFNNTSTTPGVHPLGAPAASPISPVAPVSGAAPVSSAAPVTAPAKPNIEDTTYNAGIAGDIQQRNFIKGQLASRYTNDTANATTGANKSGLLHSSTLANRLAELSTGYGNDLGNLYSQYGNPDDPNDHGTHGAALYGEAEQRHIGDPAPTVVDNPTLASLNQPANAASPNSTVQLASGWSILYDASGKPVKFLKPGETA